MKSAFGLRAVICICLFVLVFGSCPALSGGYHPALVGRNLRVWLWLARSDEVWRGEILETTTGKLETIQRGENEITLQWMNAEMRIDRVIKGAAPLGADQFQFASSPSMFLPYDHVAAGDYVVVFLSRDGDRLVFTSPYAGKMAVPSPADAQGMLEASSPGEALTQELVRALGSKRTAEVLEALRQLAWSHSSPTLHQVQKLATSADEAVRGQALDTLRAMGQTSSFADSVQELTTSPDGAVRGEAFATLIALGQTSCVPGCLEFLGAEPTDAAIEYGQRRAGHALADLPEIQLEAIADGYTQEDGADFVAALTPLLNHKTAFVRVSVTRIFRKIATRALLPTLIKLLDNPDREVQYNIMMALYHVAEGWRNTLVQGYLPARATFLEDPLRYVTQWKLWWQEGAKMEVATSLPATRVEVSAE